MGLGIWGSAGLGGWGGKGAKGLEARKPWACRGLGAEGPMRADIGGQEAEYLNYFLGCTFPGPKTLTFKYVEKYVTLDQLSLTYIKIY